MVKGKLITVIIPVYNTEQYIVRCLDSIIDNDYSNLEIICINDGSTDNSLEVLREYQKKDDRVIVIDSMNCGASHARNIGLEKAHGEYIAFIDSDDWVNKYYFSTLLKLQYEHDSDITVVGYKKTRTVQQEDRDNIELSNISVYENKSFMNDPYLKIYIWGRIYKRSSISKCRFETKAVRSEDRIFNADCYCNNPSLKLVFLDCELYYYFEREDSSVKTIDNIENIYLSTVFIDRIRSGCEKRAISIYLSESIKNALNLRYESNIKRNKNIYNEINEILKECSLIEKEYQPFNMKTKMIFRTFIKFPLLYRLFRVTVDPTLLKWEKAEKCKVSESDC